MRYLRAFGAFWHDFLIGDRPEIFAFSILLLALVWAAIRMGLDATLAGGILLVGTMVVGSWSLWRAIQPRV